MTIQPPIFQAIFGRQWADLPVVMHKHYANRPESRDIVTVQGLMKVEVSTFAKLLTPLLRLTGALVPYSGENIPVTVNFKSEPGSHAYCFERIFYFPGKKPYYFCSRMLPAGGNQVVEYMPAGIGWNASYRFDGRKILIEYRGYKALLSGKAIKLPLEWLLGRGYAEEEALTDDSFRMYMSITHPLLGKIYAYSGEFTVKEIALHG